jgi:hypothetical protein
MYAYISIYAHTKILHTCTNIPKTLVTYICIYYCHIYRWSWSGYGWHLTTMEEGEEEEGEEEEGKEEEE